MRSKLFLLAMILMLSTFAATVSADANAAPAVDRVVEAEVPADEQFTPNCEADEGDASGIPDYFAAPIHKMGFTDTCGACSQFKCRGVGEGTPCGFGVWCIAATGNLCSGTLDWRCQCASHYF